MSSSHNDWESDSSSIIENLKLLRRMGTEETSAPRVRPSTGGSSVTSSTTSTRKLFRSSASPTRQASVAFTVDHEEPARIKRTISSPKATVPSRSPRTGSVPPPPVSIQQDYSDSTILEGFRKSIEMQVVSHANGYEKKLAELQTEMTIVSSETSALSQRLNDLQENVVGKNTMSPSVVQYLQESSEAIARLEKHSAVLLGWKVTMDQDLFELAARCKPLGIIQEKTAMLENQMESLMTSVKQRPVRLEEKMEDLKEVVRSLERQISTTPDAKAVEHMVQTRVRMEMNELEGRMQEQFLSWTQKMESKLQALEKTTNTERNEAVARLHTDLTEMMEKIDIKTVKKHEWTPFQTAHVQMKEEMGQLHGMIDRHEQRMGEIKQTTSGVREELHETKNELVKALHTHQQRVMTTVEEKTNEWNVLIKEKKEKTDQRLMSLEKKNIKLEEQLKAVQTTLTSLKKEQSTITNVESQREQEQMKAKLVSTMVELEQVYTSKLALEKQMESQLQQHQQQRLALQKSLEEQEKRSEKQRKEFVQIFEQDTKKMGALEGKAAVLESILTHQKVEMEAKATAARISKKKTMVLKQKIQTMEKETEIKLTQLNTTLKAKQMECDRLVKQLEKKEIEARKAHEMMERETLALKKSKVWKEKELAMTMARLESLEQDKNEETHLETVYEEQDVVDMQAKQTELEQLLCEREAEMEEMQDELTRLHHERDQAQWRAQETLDQTVQHVATKLASQLHVLEQEIDARQGVIKELRERVHESVLNEEYDTNTSEITAAMEALKKEQKALHFQLENHQMTGKEENAALIAAHTIEMTQLRATLRLSMEDMEAAHTAAIETREVARRQSKILEKQEQDHATEFNGVTIVLKTVRNEMETVARAIHDLEREKLAVGTDLGLVQEQLSNMDQTDDKNRIKLRELQTREQALTKVQDQLQKELERQTDELIRAAEIDSTHRKTLADKLTELERIESQLRVELGMEKETIESQVEASKAREGELNAALEVLRTELGVFNGQNSGMITQVQELMSSVQRVQEHELTLQERLIRALKNHQDADEQTSWMQKAMAEQTSVLDELRRAHDAALMETTDTAARARILGQQIQTYKEQVSELRAETQALQLERDALQVQYMAALQATSTTQVEIAELRHRVAKLGAEKEALEQKIEAMESAQYTQKTAHIDGRTKLEGMSAALQQHIEAIRVKMESVEATKTRELEEMQNEIVELETTLEEAKELSSDQSDMTEQDWRTTQQALVMVAQDVRAAKEKLASACSIEEWLTLRAVVYNQEIVLDKAEKDIGRRLLDAQEAQDRAVQKVAAMQVMGTMSSREKESLRMRYLADASALKIQLERMDESWKEILAMVSKAEQQQQYQSNENKEPTIEDHNKEEMGDYYRDVETGSEVEDPDEVENHSEVDEDEVDEGYRRETHFRLPHVQRPSLKPIKSTTVFKTPFSRLLASVSAQGIQHQVDEHDEDEQQEGEIVEEEEKEDDEWDEGFRESYLFEQPR